jgi:hypothetical protein
MNIPEEYNDDRYEYSITGEFARLLPEEEVIPGNYLRSEAISDIYSNPIRQIK